MKNFITGEEAVIAWESHFVEVLEVISTEYLELEYSPGRKTAFSYQWFQIYLLRRAGEFM